MLPFNLTSRVCHWDAARTLVHRACVAIGWTWLKVLCPLRLDGADLFVHMHLLAHRERLAQGETVECSGTQRRPCIHGSCSGCMNFSALAASPPTDGCLRGTLKLYTQWIDALADKEMLPDMHSIQNRSEMGEQRVHLMTVYEAVSCNLQYQHQDQAIVKTHHTCRL